MVAADPQKLPHTLITKADGKKYQTYELTAPGTTHDGVSGRPWRGFDPSSMGRHWANTPSVMNAWDAQGEIHWAANGGWPRRIATEPFDASVRTVVMGDVWTDIDRLNQTAKERLGYPTQKPVALLERIIAASSNEGDVVLDPFCGCGTTIDAAQRLKREWIGIDVTHLAIALIRNRLDTAFPGITYRVVGEPEDLSGAATLAESDPYQFQWWALHLIGARPVGETTGKAGKKGQDRGVDGMIRFRDDPKAEKSQRILVSVKAGKNIGPAMVRDLRGTIERENAPIGVFLTMTEPTAEMRREARGAGMWKSETWQREYPRLQIITVAEAFGGKRVEYPGQDTTLQASPTAKAKKVQLTMPGGAPTGNAKPKK